MMPFPVTETVLARGQERFNTYCTPCHSRVGNGEGAIVLRGYARAGNLQDKEYIDKPLGHYFDVMTHGFGAMPDYSAQITPVDRWAVAAYIRALQLSQHATPADVPAGVETKDLAEIAKEEGLPPSAAEETKLPATAVNVDSVKPAPDANAKTPAAK
jgi:cytochrome c553